MKKKVLTILIGILLAITVMGCSGDPNNPNNPSANSSKEKLEQQAATAIETFDGIYSGAEKNGGLLSTTSIVQTMPLQLTEILRDYKTWWNEQKILHGDLWYTADRLFLQDDGKPLHPCTPRTWLTKFEAKHGLTHVPPHALRHTSITLQLLAGVPLKAVSQRAGHADEHITLNIYTHLLKEEDSRAAAVFNDFLNINN